MSSFTELTEYRCERCGSTQIYTRIITRERVCHKCGHVEKLDKDVNDIGSLLNA